MESNLNINVRTYLDDYRYIDVPLTLFCKTILSPWGTDDFIWEGTFENQQIIVKLPRGVSEQFAKIEKPDNLNINAEIISEKKRVLRKLN